MRGSAIVAGLLSVAAVADARSRQHVGKREQNKHARNDVNALNNYLATRAVPAPRFANSNTTSKSDLASVITIKLAVVAPSVLTRAKGLKG